jgi:hypothetical protein
VNPAYFASWFPFPDNSALDWNTLGDCDYLYISHLRRTTSTRSISMRTSTKTRWCFCPLPVRIFE